MSVLTTLMAAGNSIYGAWDITRVRYNPPSALKYDVSTAIADNSNYSLSTSVETGPTGIFFKPDGTKVYITGSLQDGVSQYNLSKAWDIDTVAYSNSIDFSAQDSAHNDLYISDDGLNLYTAGNTSDSIHQYLMSTAWSSATATFVRSLSVSAKEAGVSGIHFKSDGTKMFIIGNSSDSVHEYALSTAWNISTATFTQSFSVSAKATSAASLRFTTDGLNMYVLNSELVHQYTLSTAWNISTATFTRTSVKFISSLETSATGIYISDSSTIYVIGSTNDVIYCTSLGARVVTDTTNQTGIFVSTDGLNLYLSDSGTNVIVQYSLSTKNDLSSISYVRSLDVSAKEGNPEDVWFSSDGTKMFVVGSTSDSIHKYLLSTAWNISTATFSQTLSVSAQQTDTCGLHISPDGLNVYVVGTTPDYVHQYTLTTAWDLSTATYVRFFNVNTQSSNPVSVRFKNDGQKMYVRGGANKISEYVLSTAWDISTATFTSAYDCKLQTNASEGFTFNSNGSVMFIIDTAGCIYQYSVKA